MYLMTARDELVRETVRGLEAGDEHNVLVDARQVLKKHKLRGVAIMHRFHCIIRPPLYIAANWLIPEGWPLLECSYMLCPLSLGNMVEENSTYFSNLPFSNESWKLMSPKPISQWPLPSRGPKYAASALKLGTHFKWRDPIPHSEEPLFERFLPIPTLSEYSVQVAFLKAVADIAASNRIMHQGKHHLPCMYAYYSTTLYVCGYIKILV